MVCLAFTVIATVCLPAAQARADTPTSEPADCSKRPPAVNLLGLSAAHIDEPLESDRPDFTESTSTVPFGRAQLEGGYTFTYDREGDLRIRNHALPEFLFRLGVVKELELRIGWAGWSLTEKFFHRRNDRERTVAVKEHEDAAADMTLGTKVHLVQQRGLIPELGVIAELSLPTGGVGKTSGDVDPQVKLLWAYDLTDRLSLSGNVNFAVPTSDAVRFFQSSASISLGCSITEHVGTYVEYFGFYPNDHGADCAHSINGGFTFPVTPDLQFDVRCGYGLNEEADDFFSGVGFVIRI